jgi:hypothetical protein
MTVDKSLCRWDGLVSRVCCGMMGREALTVKNAQGMRRLSKEITVNHPNGRLKNSFLLIFKLGA